MNKINYSLNPLIQIDDEKLNNLNTGDIILCHGYNQHGPDPGIDGIIEIFTHSPWEHAAMIIRDPWWTKPKLNGVYIYQSSGGPNSYNDVLNGKNSGVTLNKLEDFLRNRKYIFVRTLQNFTFDSYNKTLFVNIFNETHGKPYDKNAYNWFCTGVGSFCKCKCFSNKIVPEHTNSFWCSALVAFYYDKMNWCNNLNWSDKTPADLFSIKAKLPLILSSAWQLK